jgi:hypothetical protein
VRTLNDRNKTKQRMRMNIMTANPIVKASVFLFFPTSYFFKTISAAAQTAHLVLPDTRLGPTLWEADPSQNQKSHFLPTQRMTLGL